MTAFLFTLATKSSIRCHPSTDQQAQMLIDQMGSICYRAGNLLRTKLGKLRQSVAFGEEVASVVLSYIGHLPPFKLSPISHERRPPICSSLGVADPKQ